MVMVMMVVVMGMLSTSTLFQSVFKVIHNIIL